MGLHSNRALDGTYSPDQTATEDDEREDECIHWELDEHRCCMECGEILEMDYDKEYEVNSDR